MLVFVDESGCSGFKFDKGSSAYFTMVAILFVDRAQAQSCDDAISQLRHEMHWPPSREFKFNKLSPKQRIQFLSRVEPFDFSFYTFSLDKRRLWEGSLRRSDRMYRKVIEWICENAEDRLVEATIVADSTGPDAFAAELDSHLRTKTKPGKVHRLRMEASHSNNLLHLADMVAGASSRRLSSKPDAWTYFSIIRSRCVSDRTWP